MNHKQFIIRSFGMKAGTLLWKISSSCKPDALVLFNPVIDNRPGGYGYDRIGERYMEISSLHNIRKGIPPTIFFPGTGDHLIPVSTAEDFQKKMRAEGNRPLPEIPGISEGGTNHWNPVKNTRTMKNYPNTDCHGYSSFSDSRC